MTFNPKRTPGGGWYIRRFYLFLSLIVVAGLTLAIVAFATGPVGTAAGFEDDDANLTHETLFDWNDFDPVTWTGSAPYRVSTKTTSGWVFNGFEDDQASNADSGFAGGVKQDNDCAQVKGGKAPNKDDLKRVYLANKTVNGDVYLELAFVRIPLNSTQSSTHIGFEFNEGKLGACPAAAKADGLVKRTPQAWGGTPTPHSGGDPTNPGDLLIVYDYEGGSGPPVITLRHWIDANTTLDPPYDTCEISSDSPPCWSQHQDLTAEGFAEGQVNRGGNPPSGAGIIDALAPPAANATPPQLSVDATLGLKEFGEAGINLTDAGVFTPGVCTGFGQAEAVSRSSGNSGNAAMEDIDGPGAISITNCATVDITKVGNDSGSQAGAVFTLYNGPDTSGTVVGTCTVTAATEPNCGTGATSFSDLPPGQYTLDETTVPNGYTKDANLPVTFTLAAGDAKTFAFTDTALPGKVSVTKVDDHGDPVDGAVFSIYSPAGVDANNVPTGNLVASCTTASDPNATPPTAGQCTISNVTPGTYTIDEVVPAGYAKDSTFPKNITLTNGENEIVNATDPRLFKAIVLVCRQTDNTLYKSGITIDTDTRPGSESRSQLDTLIQTWATAQGLGVLTTADKDAFEHAVCGVTAGAKGGLRSDPHASNPHDADIDINNSPLP
jgi:Prealbumin-like fold domain